MISMDHVRKEIGRHMQRAVSLIRRGIIQTVSAAYYAQVEAFEGELYDNVALWQQFGMTSRPPAGGEAAIAKVEGSGEAAVIVATNDDTHRPATLSVGDAMLYAQQASGGGQAQVHAKADGDVDLTPGTGQHVGVGGHSEALLLGDSMISKLTALNVAVTALPAAADLATAITLANGLKAALLTYSASASALAASKGKVT